VGQVVRDKDGMSAAVVFADLSAEANIAGVTLWDLLADLAERHGLWVSAQHSVTRPGADGRSEIGGAVDKVAASPPRSLGGMTVTDVVDLRLGGRTRPPWLPDSDLVELRFGTEGRTLVRPSGTEPKLKIYVDLRLDPPSGSFIDADDAGRARAAAIGAQLAAELGL
jgi:phosphomannomutase